MQAMSARDVSGPEALALSSDALLPAPDASTPAPPLLYLQIALRLALMVSSGALRPGQRLPSVRDSAAQNNVSVATVVQALAMLEEHRLVQPRARSGYFVAPASRAKAAALVRKIRREPELSKTLPDPGSTEAALRTVVSFAGYAPKDKDFFDTDRIRVALSRATRLKRDTLAEYTSSVGTLALRNAVALRGLHLGCALKAEDIVITSGCINAVALCLQAVTQPGDMVAIESPTFFGFLDLLESLNLKALALPTDPRTGVSLPALQLALDTQPIKALLLVPTLSNPLASVMPLTQKRALARMAAQYQVPLIEDVVFNDLLATDARRRAVKAYDSEGWVMTCGSFAKTVAPGIRLGWVDAGRWSKQVGTLKRVQGAATNAVLEHALADLLTQGGYEAHLRRLCLLMKQRLGQARKIIQASFPAATRVNDPPAGYTLWVELPAVVDTMVLFDACKAQCIVVGPGQLFCASHRYRHCLRLSFSGIWGAREQAALAEVGRLAGLLVDSAKAATDSGVMEVSRMDFMCREEVSAYDLW
jgi:DNA-binding transcriptional MocR family regulator